MIFGAAYYPEHREKQYWEYDLKKMQEAHINALRIGEFAWKRFEPKDGQYDFTWLDEFIELASKRNIGILLCPPLRTVPAWMVEKDNSIMIENKEGIRLEYGSRYTFCTNNTYLREKGLKLAEQMAKRYGSNENVIGWHLDNEYGDEIDCHCPICKDKWHNWLKNKYKDIDELNKKWGTVFWGLEYDKFEQIPTPKITKANHNPAFIQNWRHFRSDCTVEIVKLQSEAIKKYANQPVTTNNQMIWNYRTDYYKMANHLDVCGTNYYPPYGTNQFDSFGLANVRSYKQKNFYIYELRNNAHMTPGRCFNMPKPGEVERTTMHSFANGADGIYYFRFRSCPFGCEQNHGTLVSYNGEPTRIFYECKNIGEKLNKISNVLDGTSIKSEVAVMYDFPTRWMEENDSAWTAPSDLYIKHEKKIYNAVRKLGVNCDTVGREQDFSKYKILIVPMVTAFTDEFADKICDYVKNGGTLIWHPLSGYKNEDAIIYNGRLHPKLQELFDINIIDFGTIDKNKTVDFTWNNKIYSAEMFFDFAKTTNNTEGHFINCWFDNLPITINKDFGKSKVHYITTFANEDFYIDYFKSIFESLDIRPIIKLDKNNFDKLEIVKRSNDKTEIIFVINYSDKVQKFEISQDMHDIWNDSYINKGHTNIKENGVMILSRS